jgi:ABC-type sugar transport system substrate-binding protein
MGHTKALRTAASVLMTLVLVSFLAACGGTTGGNQTSTGGTCSQPPKLTKTTGLKVGFSQEVNNSPWRIAETDSIQSEGKNRGDTVIVTNANNSDSQQNSDIQNLISQKVDVLLIAPLTEDGEVSAIKQAAAACIPVFLVDRDADHSKVTPGKDYVTFIGSDFVKEGQRVADWMIQNVPAKLKPPYNVIELEGTTGSSPAIARGSGFNNEIKTNSNFTIIAHQDANFDRATAMKDMQTLLQAHPNVNVVYAHNDEMALGAIDALKAAGKTPGKDVIVGSIDGEKQALQDIQSGEEGVVIQCNPRLGPAAFDQIAAYGKGTVPAAWIVSHDNQYDASNAATSLAQNLGF